MLEASVQMIIDNNKEKIMTLSIQPYTGYDISTKKLSEIKDMYSIGELDTYSVWLQRLKQHDKWSKRDWEKSRSYLFRLFTSGSITKSIFTVVDINLLINKIQERIEASEALPIHASIFSEMIKALKVMEVKGCKYVLLDGQNRLEYAIKRFYQNELEFRMIDKLTKVPKDVFFRNHESDERYSKKSFTYEKLTPEEKNVIDDIRIIFAEGKEGEIDEYIDDLIDDNSGEHWNDFEKKITNLKTLPHLVNTAVSQGECNVPEFVQFLDRTGALTGDYHVEKKGYHKILCELTQLDMNGTLKLDYEVMWDNTKHDKITESFNNVKEFFKTLGKGTFGSDKSKNVFATKELLRNFYMITQILKSGVGGYNIPNNKIKNIRAIYDDFMKFDNFKRDRNKNADDYIEVKTLDGNMRSEPKPGSYIWAMKDIGNDKLQSRKSILISWCEENIERWIKEDKTFKRLDRDKVTPIQKERLILNAQKDPFSAHNQTLDRFVDDLHVDHIKQFGRGGSNDDSNLQVTTSHSNLSRVK
jgi:hypothetical protein